MRAVIYARYSTDRQSESSIADQLRVCREYAAREGWSVVGEYTDEGISGAAIGNRPGLLQLIEAALARGFDVLLVMDSTRLSRSQADLPKLIDRFVARGIRVLGVQDGLDTARRGYKLMAGIHGIFGEQFREQVREKTYTALETRAQLARPTGGRAYGYDSQRRPIESEAAIVREIFERYARGEPLREIAHSLNCRGIPSPGARWKRRERRQDGPWLQSALHEMLRNEIYIGRLIWNRRAFMKDPDSGKRIARERPRSEWIVHEVPELRIIDDETWQRVQQRTRHNASFGNSQVRPKYLLSGLLECGVCRAKFIIVGGKGQRYACGTNRAGGDAACSNDLTVRRDVAEELILAPVVEDLLAPETVRAMADYMRAEFRREQIRPAVPEEVARLDAEMGEIRRLVQEGVLRPERGRMLLEDIQRERSALLRTQARAMAPASTEELIAAYTAKVTAMRQVLQGEDVAAARGVLREILGTIRLEPAGWYLMAHFERGPVALLTGTGVDPVVAGAGFERIYPPVRLIPKRCP